MKDRVYLVYCEGYNKPGTVECQSARDAAKKMFAVTVNGRALNLVATKVVVELTGEVVPEDLWK